VSDVILQPGDHLLYGPKGLAGWVISLKTWSDVAHCEFYLGDMGNRQQMSLASRDGLGVNAYPLRTATLAYILRPKQKLNLVKGIKWFLTRAQGQQYDWWGLLRFAWRSRVVPEARDNRMFCSEFLTRFDRACDFDPFNGYDADAIAPSEFLKSNSFDIVWRASEHKA